MYLRKIRQQFYFDEHLYQLYVGKKIKWSCWRTLEKLWNWGLQKTEKVDLVDLVKRFPTSIWSRKLASRPPFSLRFLPASFLGGPSRHLHLWRIFGVTTTTDLHYVSMRGPIAEVSFSLRHRFLYVSVISLTLAINHCQPSPSFQIWYPKHPLHLHSPYAPYPSL